MPRGRPLLLLTASMALCCVTPSPSAPAAVSVPKSSPAPAIPVSTRAFRQERAIVLRHATVMPASSPAIANGAVSFADGRIVQVGKNADVPTPPGADEMDVSGKVITPGIIDAHSHLGV